MELGRSGLQRRFSVDDGRQRLVVDVDKLQGIFRLVPAVGDHYGHRITHIAHHILGDRWVGNLFNVGVRNYPSTGNGVQHPVGVGAGVHRQHAVVQTGQPRQCRRS